MKPFIVEKAIRLFLGCALISAVYPSPSHINAQPHQEDRAPIVTDATYINNDDFEKDAAQELSIAQDFDRASATSAVNAETSHVIQSINATQVRISDLTGNGTPNISSGITVTVSMACSQNATNVVGTYVVDKYDFLVIRHNPATKAACYSRLKPNTSGGYTESATRTWPYGYGIYGTQKMGSIGDDLLLATMTNGGPSKYRVAMVNTSGSFTFGLEITIASVQWVTSFAFADVNSDGLKDVIYIQQDHGGQFTTVVKALLRNSAIVTPTFATTPITVLTDANSANNPIFGDFNNDGHLDIYLPPDDDTPDMGQGFMAFKQLSGTYVVSPSIDFYPAIETSQPDFFSASANAVDVNLDGKLDLVSHQYVWNVSSQVVVYFNNGTGNFSSTTGISLTAATAAPKVFTWNLKRKPFSIKCTVPAKLANIESKLSADIPSETRPTDKNKPLPIKSLQIKPFNGKPDIKQSTHNSESDRLTDWADDTSPTLTNAQGWLGTIQIEFETGFTVPNPVQLWVTNDGLPTTLNDAGTNGDVTSGDGIYTAQICLSNEEVALVTQSSNPLSRTLPSAPGVPVTIDFNRELMITDLGVVKNITRTVEVCPNDQLPTTTITTNGVWTFKRLIMNALSTTNESLAAVEVENWINIWNTPQAVNGFLVPSRPSIPSQLLTNWPRKNGKLDLDVAPFRLLGISTRLDLRDNPSPTSGSAGELRFIWGVLNRTATSCNPSPFTVIFEYKLPAQNTTQVKQWASKIHALTNHAIGSTAYNAALQAITQPVTGPGKGNLNLGQIRTNEIAGAFPWQLREFILAPNGALNKLVITDVKQTPDDSLNGSPVLASFINANQADVLHISPITGLPSPRYTVPVTMRGGKSDVAGPWTATGVTSPPALNQFALNTCNNCHVQSGTPFTHLSTRSANVASTLSPFLIGADPTLIPLIGFQNDIQRRDDDLRRVLLSTRWEIVAIPGLQSRAH